MLDENIDKLSSEEINDKQEDVVNDEIKNLQKDNIDNKINKNVEIKSDSEKEDGDLQNTTENKEKKIEPKEEPEIKEGQLEKELNEEVSSEIIEDTDEKEKLVAVNEVIVESDKTESNEVEKDEEKQNEDDIKEIVVEEDKTESNELKKDEHEQEANDVKVKEEGISVENEISKETKQKDKTQIPIVDFSKLNLEDLVVHFKNLLDNFSIHDAKPQIELLITNFTKKFKEILLEKKKEFLEAGGNELDFHFKSPVKNSFNDLAFDYKKKRKQYYKDLETEQSQNLEKRLELIDELKDLIDNAEASTMYKNFKVLQDKWRGTGQIPHNKYNNVWRTYHHHVERFYDLLHLNNDFRDLDFKHNLEEKTKLVETAEKLVDDKDINHAFKELQVLHRMWKEDIGPVARELREEIWTRFSEATMKIHQKRHEFQDKLDEKLNSNIDLKLAVIEKIKAINFEGIVSHKEWQERIKNLEKIREEFFAVGRVPRSKNEEIWQLFKDATRNFNKAKNSFYKGIKKDQSKNLKKKLDLLEQAESLKDSDDWEMVTDVFKKIQSDWKNIGHVPSRDSDKIWKKFKNACNHYFDRLHDKQDGANKEQTEVFNKKKDFLDQFKEKLNQEEILTIEWVNENIKSWRELGTVPIKMRHIDSKFNKALDLAYKKLNIDKEEAIFLKFKNIIDSYIEQNDDRKIDSERLFVRRKMDELSKEIKQLENNISFISNASEDNPLVKNVYKNIENYKNEFEVWKRKILYLKQINN